MKTQRIRTGWVALSAVLGLGCTGELHGPGSAGAPANPGGQGGSDGLPGGGSSSIAGTGSTSELPTFVAPAGMLRRLTRAQFKNALFDLLGVEVDATQLDQDSYTGNFAVIGASTVVTSQTGVEQYQAAVESAVASVMADATKRMQLVGCAPSNGADACIRAYLSSLGRRAWRRPLESAEMDRLAGIADSASTALGSTTEGLRWATVALLTSPHFLYRPELGAAAQDGTLKLTAYETASRLAFLIWNSLPDAALLDAAANGQLGTAEGVRSSVERLLDAPAGRAAIGNFAEEYLRLDRVLSQAKDSQAFPAYGPALQAGMVRDMRGTWETLAFDDRASALELFSTPKVVVNAELAKLYGLDPTGLSSTT
ncbi:MAG TPA: DUF1592 domain-containing protein, partial [Polyangiaceae bacterium]|nr:DUF1592 domain-containing protein [Polyangiaceae bacterium]